MPLYEYHCHKCGKNLEALQKFSDEPLKVHENCGGELERLISAPSFQFKGSGWYVTDYGKGGQSPAPNGKTESKSGDSSSSSSSSSSDKKPADTKPAASTPSDK